MKEKVNSEKEMSVLAKILVFFAFVFVLLIVYALYVHNTAEFWAEQHCGEEVSFSTPAWFSCGSGVDHMGENFYSLGMFPPFTIEKYKPKSVLQTESLEKYLCVHGWEEMKEDLNFSKDLLHGFAVLDAKKCDASFCEKTEFEIATTPRAMAVNFNPDLNSFSVNNFDVFISEDKNISNGFQTYIPSQVCFEDKVDLICNPSIAFNFDGEEKSFTMQLAFPLDEGYSPLAYDYWCYSKRGFFYA